MLSKRELQPADAPGPEFVLLGADAAQQPRLYMSLPAILRSEALAWSLPAGAPRARPPPCSLWAALDTGLQPRTGSLLCVPQARCDRRYASIPTICCTRWSWQSWGT